MTKLAWAAATDVGRVREHNEDSFQAGPRVFAVADGMGGHAAGEVASALVIEKLAEIADSPALTADEVVSAIDAANRAIIRAGLQNPRMLGMGTTLTGLALVAADPENGTPTGSAERECWAVFNVGDSRVYRLFGSEFSQVTEDHSEVQELVNAGRLTPDEARRYPRRNVVTRSLGTLPPPEADVLVRDVVCGERFVICSDGLNGELTDDEIAEVLTAAADPDRAAADLVARALDAGGEDNVTVIVVEVLDA